MAIVHKHFIHATKGKVILGFLFACFALLMAWGISKFVFKEILGTVEKISAPNDRLKIVNALSHQVGRLDQLQREQAVNNTTKNVSFIKETKSLRYRLDTLAVLYANDAVQLKRIKSLKRLLADRDQQFLMYLKVRETLVNTKSFSNEVQKLNELFSQKSRQADSTILTTETATSTTTLAPDGQQKSKGFLSRLFGKKKAEVYRIINEEYKVKRDTLNPLVQDSIMQHVETSLQAIELEQREKSDRFLKRESELASSSNALTKQMLSILREVEAEALAQIDSNGLQAKEIVNDGVIQITVVMIVFFLFTLVLGYLILTDMTKSNRYREALELAKDEAEYHGKAKQRFLSNMSHEIRTPLQSILGYAELVDQQAQPNKTHVKAIHHSAEHLLQIVNEVLDYNRIISGEFSFESQHFDIEAVLKQVINIMQPLAAEKGLQLIADFNIGEDKYVNGDAFRLKQILLNLLGNAVKFTLKGQVKLQVDYKKQGQDLHYYFIIEDTGIGFEDADASKIFNEFEQIDIPEKSLINKNGTGLGLAIVKTIVESQGGRIGVKSKLGLGTTFTVYLKYLAVDHQKQELAKPQGLLDLQGHAVWVIDDDRLILDLCGLIFNQHHIRHQCFDTSAQVLAAVADPNVKYVLIDIRLPGMSGVELCKALKRKLDPKVKYYAITAQVLPDERQAVLDEGFEGIIMKPFRASDLLAIFGTNPLITEPIDFDRSVLQKMTMDDAEMIDRILARFREDCEADTATLKINIANEDQAEARLIVHRLAGRIAQIGAKQLAASFRQLEQKVATQTHPLAMYSAEIDTLLGQLQMLMLQTTSGVYSIP